MRRLNLFSLFEKPKNPRMKTITDLMKHKILMLVLLMCYLSPVLAQTNGSKAIIDAAKYPSLQAAIDALPVNGGIVHIPPGEYELSKPLLVTTENTRLQGSGGATHLINRNQQGEPAVIVKSGKGDQFRVELSNFRISGNSKSGDGIYMEKVQELLITAMTF